ncbi:MAG: GTP cyclohydrolase I FolE [Bacteroidota bacterium]
MLVKKLEDDSIRLDDSASEAVSGQVLRTDAFLKTDAEKIYLIENYFKQIMHTLGLDLEDDSLKDTPHRVARMYVHETFSGLNPKNKPDMTLFENTYGYDQMLIEKNITVYSSCEHHFVPIIGKAHVAYIPSGKIIGLSKINRIVQYCASRPQVQERLTVQIASELQDALGIKDIAVVVDAAHLCVSARGIRDIQSSTLTSFFDGKFRNEEKKKEFLSALK